MTFGGKNAPDLAQDLVRLRLVFERVRQDHGVDRIRGDRERIGARADRGGPTDRPRAVPRQHGFALGPAFGEQPVVVTPQSDLQQLPAEDLGERFGRDLALQRVHTLAERAAQPGMQIRRGVVGHGGENSADHFRTLAAPDPPHV